VPLGDRLSLNIQNGFAATGTLASAAAAPLVANSVASAPGAPIAQVYSTESRARIDYLPTGTSLVTGGAISTADDKWLRQIGIEQKLPGGVSLNGALRETAAGPPDRSITAGFKRTW
jgi:hypothetical protein